MISPLFWLHNFQIEKSMNQKPFYLIFHSGSQSTSGSPRGNEVFAVGASFLYS